MQWAEENEEKEEQEKKTKKLKRIILAFIILFIILGIAVFAYMIYYDSTLLKYYKNGGQINPTTGMFVIEEDGEIYVSVSKMAKYLNYNFYYGEYNITSEENKTKGYVRPNASSTGSSNSSTNIDSEIAAFEIGSNIMKKTPASNSQPGNQIDYDEYIISQPVKLINDEMYVSKEGASKAFNILIEKDENKITIYTLEYLVSTYTSRASTFGFTTISTTYNNQKAILYGAIIGSNANKEFGCVSLDKKQIISTRYEDINFNEYGKEFIVKIGSKYGVLNFDSTIKINSSYDKLEILDKKLNYYLVENSSKKGIINKEGQVILHTEYDSIGVDVSGFKNQDIKNPKLLLDNCIPIVKDRKLGIADTTGKIILPIEYSSLGCKISTVDGKSVNSVLVIKECEGIVVNKDNKYGIIHKSGEILVHVALDNVYSKTESDVTTYYMQYNGQTLKVIDYLTQLGLMPNK